MNYSEKNGQPSMEEILASIRRIIADEPQGASPIIDLRGTSRPLNLLSTDEDDSPDFQLPSIFRPQPAPDKTAPLFGRLTDAIRQASGSAEARSQEAPSEPPYAAPAHYGPGANGSSNPGLSALNVQRPVQASDFSHVVPVKPQQSAEPVAEEPAKPEATSSWWGGGATRPAQPPESEVKREMVPFRDTRMSGMGSVPVYHPEDFATQRAAPVEPAAVVSHTPAPSPTSTIDFSAIVPGQQDVPAHMAMELWRDPAPATPIPPYTGAAVESPPPPPLPNAAESNQKPGSAAPSGTIEDATADLLRPMLRQWLAENMPRMVEKALHIEVAQSVRPMKKPPGQ